MSVDRSDPIGCGVRTTCMPKQTIIIAEPIVVSMVDVLAILRLPADAEIVCIRHLSGATTALRVAELLHCHHMWLEVTNPSDALVDEPPQAHLCSLGAPASPIASVDTMTFASFVGLP